MEEQVPRPEQNQSDLAQDKIPFHSSNPVTNLKAVLKFNKLLSTHKVPGPPTTFQPPWKKARIFPIMETVQSVETTKPNQGSDSSESGMVIDGIFFQTKEGTVTGQKLFSKQVHNHNKSQSNTSNNTNFSGDIKTPFFQAGSNLEMESFVRNSQQSASKIEHVNGGCFLGTHFDRYVVSSISTHQRPYLNRPHVAYMSDFDSDDKQEIFEKSGSESSSDTEQDNFKIEFKTRRKQGLETHTERETETESGDDKKSRNKKVSKSKKKTKSKDFLDSRHSVTDTQEFVRSVL
ncbi:MAG: hypothetical protein ACRC4N_04350, partial [Gammaproteobacteria bacterium]